MWNELNLHVINLHCIQNQYTILSSYIGILVMETSTPSEEHCWVENWRFVCLEFLAVTPRIYGDYLESEGEKVRWQHNSAQQNKGTPLLTWLKERYYTMAIKTNIMNNEEITFFYMDILLQMLYKFQGYVQIYNYISVSYTHLTLPTILLV